MGTALALHPSASYSGAQLELIRRTVAADCNIDEFNLFVTVAQRAGLDPFRKQISAIVFNKTDDDKRKMAIITNIDGLRAIAARSKRYRPDEAEAVIIYDNDLRSLINPLGIVKATARIWITDAMREGGWKPVAGVAYWDEFVPTKEIWAENERGRREPTGEFKLDKTSPWFRMGRIMIAKCAEAQALRKAFPEDMSGLYEGAEMDQALTPSEIIGEFTEEQRLAKAGVLGGVMFQMAPDAPLESVPLGQVFDRVCEAIESFRLASQIQWFQSANIAPLREYWARSPGDALELKKRIEAVTAQLEASGDDHG